MSLSKDFKAFTMRGNVVDLAVAVIIGGAFGKIVASFVNDVLMPPLGLLLGGVNFKDLMVILKPATTELAAVTINYGQFVQNVIDFLIIAFAIFIMIKAINASKKKEETIAAPPPPAQSKEEELLTEIRDLLKRK